MVIGIIGLEKYYFLFALAFVFVVCAVIFDLRKREVPNWLNFSLIAFALAYRAFYSVSFNDWMFFVYGLLGFAVFCIFGNLFYYLHFFAGGDAKLLMGLGVILPFSSWNDLIYVSLGFIILLCLVGAVYSIIYSLFIAFGKNYLKFKKEFVENLNKKRFLIVYAVILALILLAVSVYVRMGMIGFLFALIIVFISILYVYLLAVDFCMIRLVNPSKLTEGDWILNDVRLKGYVVKKTVHGLTIDDIIKLRKAGKKIFVKSGIPFTPAILLAFLIMVFFFLVLKLDFHLLISSLF